MKIRKQNFMSRPMQIVVGLLDTAGLTISLAGWIIVGLLVVDLLFFNGFYTLRVLV